MIKIVASVQFLLCLEISEVTGFQLEHDQVTWNQESVNLSLFM